MKSFSINIIVTGTFAQAVNAQRGPWAGGGGGPAGYPPCSSQCWNTTGSQDWSPNGLTSFCLNSSAIEDVNSCVASSSCDETAKRSTYQLLAQICANDGNPLTASPEASFSATSGGSQYPTGSGWWASYASLYGSGEQGGWHKGGAHGPFGAGAPGNGYGPWSPSGSWVDGPWTAWWGKACPPSTWTGWTSNGAANAPWTTWTACTAETTATSVVTTTTTLDGTATQVTRTNFGLRVSEATSSTVSSSGSSYTTSASNYVSPGMLGMLIMSMLVCLASW